MKINIDSIEFTNIDDLGIFVRYDPKNSKSVPKGYVLAEDLLNNKGGVLYAKNTEVDAERIGRLMRILENNPEVKPKFVIQLNDTVMKTERQKLLSALSRLIESKAGRKVFSQFVSGSKKILESRINDILKAQEIVLHISKLKFLEDKSKKSKINPFYNHMLNTLIFSMGIVENIIKTTQEKYQPEEIGEIGLVALLHANGGWETSGQFIDLALEERKTKYIEANEKNHENLKLDKLISRTSTLSDNVLDAVKMCYEFQTDRLDFLQQDTKAAQYAKIVSIASFFNESISGLWGSARTPKEVVDQFYVKIQTKKAPKLQVDALAKGLKFDDLFDFYHELEVLNNLCKRNAGKSYPMTGFKSPVLYVCHYNLRECKEYVASAKAISVFKEIGGLEEGEYGRCEALSNRLINFYEEHYKEIKEDVMAKQFGPKKENDDGQANDQVKESGKDSE